MTLSTEAEILQKDNAEMQAIFAAMDQLIFVFDADGRHLKIPSENPKLQYKPDHSRVGKTLHEVFPLEVADQFLGYIQQSLSTGEALNVEYSLELDGKILWSDACISPIDANSVVWVVRDVTKRKLIDQELVQAHAEILALNDRLKTENLRLSMELEVTRQIQQMILPKELELNQIPELEIAGFMEPATEVGGDYYDVLFQDGGVNIAIGDVTGHGLESGVLMLMVQTAVRTLLVNHETNPLKFLSALNRVIYQNAKRMNSTRNLSLSILDYKDGHVCISGQHEELIIVSGGEIKLIDTMDLGFLIGLEPDITDFVDKIELQLAAGDGVILYSDGITEAENQQRVLYGLERLCAVIKQNWHQSATAIRQAVIADVRSHINGHRVYDDMTLVVLKQR